MSDNWSRDDCLDHVADKVAIELKAEDIMEDKSYQVAGACK